MIPNYDHEIEKRAHPENFEETSGFESYKDYEESNLQEESLGKPKKEELTMPNQITNQQKKDKGAT